MSYPSGTKKGTAMGAEIKRFERLSSWSNIA